MIPILILAAGQSRRMGGPDKLLETVAGEPLLRRLVRAAGAAGLSPHVALPAADHPRARALDGLSATRLVLEGSAEGMGGTLREGVAALPDCARFLVTAADLPGLTAEDLAAVAAADAGEALIVIATDAAGRPGHPIAFDASLRPAFAQLSGDLGARGIVAANRARIRSLPLPGDHATRDLDTPEDWAAWRRDNPL